MFEKLIQYVYGLIFFKFLLLNIIEDPTKFYVFVLLRFMYYNVKK